MTITGEQIDVEYEAARDQLAAVFRAKADRFFTEADLTAFLAARLHERLRSPREQLSPLVHLEYPTPFRCSMKPEFEWRSPDTKARRGHHDLVVLDPAFEAGHELAFLHGQSFEVLQRSLESLDPAGAPPLRVVVELMYLRTDFTARGPGKKGERTAAAIVRDIRQDLEKARETANRRNLPIRFARRAEMLVFGRGQNPAAQEAVSSMFGVDEVRFVWA